HRSPCVRHRPGGPGRTARPARLRNSGLDSCLLRTVRVIVGRDAAWCSVSAAPETENAAVAALSGSDGRCPEWLGGIPGRLGSELAAEGELDPFLVVAVRRLRAERHRQADDQRADRRLPVQRNTGRGAQGAGVEALVVLVGIADIGEQRYACGVDVLQERQRQVELGGAEYLERTADGL